MNHAGTICQCYIRIAGHIECFLMLFLSTVICTLIEWFILLVFQFFSFISLQNFVCFFSFLCQLSKNGIEKRTCHIIGISIYTFYFCIVFIRIHTECDVGRQCPRCCGPCENICILIFYLETNDRRTFFYILISLCNLLSRQRRPTARAVWNNFKSFIEKTLLPDLFQCPPLRFDKVIIISYIWVFHICPETYGRGKIFPHSFILPDTFLTFVDKWFQTILLNLILSIQSQKLLNFQLNRQSMGIPSCLTRYHVTLHGTVSWNHIFNNTGKNVSDMRFSVRSRRSVIESIGFSFFPVLHTLFKNVIFFPEFFGFLFPVNKLQVCRYFFVLGHGNTPFKKFSLDVSTSQDAQKFGLEVCLPCRPEFHAKTRKRVLKKSFRPVIGRKPAYR